MYSERSITFRLNRFFNIFNPKVYKFLIVLNGILLVWGIYLISANKQSVCVYIASIAFGNIIAATTMVFHCPKTIVISKEMVKFEDYINMRPEHIHRNGFWWLKVSYSVSEIKEIQFHQNVIEKTFNVGHISFSGKATFTAKRDIDRIKEKDTFIIYGIKNFSDFMLNFPNN